MGGGGQHPAPEGRKIGNPLPLDVFDTFPKEADPMECQKSSTYLIFYLLDFNNLLVYGNNGELLGFCCHPVTQALQAP